jgi:hypothetical protein
MQPHGTPRDSLFLSWLPSEQMNAIYLTGVSTLSRREVFTHVPILC